MNLCMKYAIDIALSPTQYSLVEVLTQAVPALLAGG